MKTQLIEKLIESDFDIVAKTFEQMGFACLSKNHINANGPDITITKGSFAYTVEIKRTKSTDRNSLQVQPVLPNRQNDDLIAIVFPNRYVLIESMKDHLKLCTEKGYRTLPGFLAQ